MTGRPEGLIFDLGGVLLDFDHMETCRLLSERISTSKGRSIGPGEIYRRVVESRIGEEYDRGLPTEDFLKEVSRMLGAVIPVDEFRPAWCNIFREKTDVTELLGPLKDKAELMLLSNTNKLHFDCISSRFPFVTDSFSRLFLSYKLGVSKPDRRVYETVIESSGISPSRLFYIDDRADFVEAARGLGIDGITFTGAPALKEKLLELGF